MGIASDNSIRDPRHLKEIERAIVGDESELMVRFLEHAKRDHKAEQEQRKRIAEGSDEVERPYFKKAAYIEKRHKGQIDYMSKPATEQDKRDFPQQWERFEQSKNQPPKHHISLLPGCGVCEQAIFNELNITAIEDFLEFSEKSPEILSIFDELGPLLEVAKRWRTFMKPRLKLVEGKVQ